MNLDPAAPQTAPPQASATDSVERRHADSVARMRTIPAALRRALAVAPSALAVVDSDTRLTYEQLGDRVERLIGLLHELGLRAGDRVAVLSLNSHHVMSLYLAVPSAGMVLVPLNTRHTDHELLHAISDSGARVLLADRDFDGLDGNGVPVIRLDATFDLRREATRPRSGASDVAEHDLAGIFYTGGTTGAAKGVMLTHGNLVANAFHFMTCWPFTPSTVFLVVAPMFHAAGTAGVLATIWTAGTQILLPRFDPGVVLDTIERERVTATILVPTMLNDVAPEQLARPRDVSTLRWLGHGASPAPAALLERTSATFPHASMLHVYGLTETSPIATLHPDEQDAFGTAHILSCGRPAIGVEIAILDLTSRHPLPTGEIGEVAVRGPNVTAGYWNQPSATASAFCGDWFVTGDLGYLDADGFLFLVDRVKDLIVTGGENVYCAEVENALHSHPAVTEAAVFGVPHSRYGEAVKAVVVTHSAVEQEELLSHCRSLIAGYKVPRDIEIRSTPLPKSAVGKVLKRDLR